jgi:amino acid adenylation domain-containing protein/non-ribosomal peptide synthase protein (TIGR01720 family)
MSTAKHDGLVETTVPENSSLTMAGTPSRPGLSLELPETGETDYSLTLEQQRLWFLGKLQPNNPAYTLQTLVTINGPVDLELLREAWLQVIGDHDALRARFGEIDGKPYQQFRELDKLDFPVFDLVGIDSARQGRYIQEVACQQSRQPFSLEHDLLFRLTGFQLAPDAVTILFTTHEIVMDARSVAVVMRQVQKVYSGLHRGHGLANIQVPHYNLRHYAYWESQHLQTDSFAGQAAYWRDQLAGKLPVLDLPTDVPRTGTPSLQGSSTGLLLDSVLSDKLKQLAESQQATLPMTLLTVFYIILANYTGQDDLIIGTSRVNRSLQGTEAMVGPFVNLLPLRVQVSPSDTFTGLLNRVNQTLVNGRANADYPLLWMAGLTDAICDGNRSPIFQAMFQMDSDQWENGQSTPVDAAVVIDLSFRQLETGFTKYELTLTAQERDGQIALRLSYFTDLYQPVFMERMLKNLGVLLRSIVKYPRRKIAALEFVSSEEKKLLVSSLNQTYREYNYDVSISRLFEDQVAKTPKKTAYIFENETISYRELNVRANQLARYLQRVGARPGMNVALCIARSFEMLTGMLAIIKLGAAYVPLDPNYPLVRLEEIIKDTGAEFLITHTSVDRFQNFAGKKVLVDQEINLINQEAESNLAGKLTGDQVLNIIYTSSSTGRPKGVVISNRAVLNRLYWMWEEYPFHSNDVAVFHKSYALVAATWECFGALLKGIPTLLAARADVLDPAAFWPKLVKYQVSYFLATPALIQGILAQGELHPGTWRSLRLATTSAEPIPVSMVAQWYRVFPDVPLLNLYGATECASNATVYNTQALECGVRRVPLGRPLANTRIFIINEHHQLAPFGVIGEMCVSGDCLASGYLNLAELTQEKFGPNPFVTQQCVLYKSGDLARYRADGNLELVGRKDYQVKIRGFRIELGDIELAIVRYETVRKCAVKFFTHDDGRQRLVAYIQAGQPISTSQIRHFLSQYLPDYMIPADYVFMEKIPVTLSGKVNRKVLEEPTDSQLNLDNDFVPPKTEVEQFLVKVWSELLRRPQVGIRDNFFDLGGHSLLAIQMVAKIFQCYQVELPVRKIYELPTVFSLAQAIEATIQSMPYVNRPLEVRQPMKNLVVTGIVPLTPSQTFILSRWDEIIQPNLRNISRQFEVDNNFDSAKLQQVLTYLWEIHDVLRARFVKRGNRWKQIIVGPEQSTPDYREYNLADTPVGDEERVIAEYAELLHKSINITQGPLMITAYLNFGPKRPGRLMLIVHHILVDGNSMTTLGKDLQTAYLQLRDGKAITLPKKGISIKEWAELVHEYVLSDHHLQTIDYCLGLPWGEIPDLPIDYPQNRSQNLFNSSAKVSMTLTVEETTVLTRQIQLVLHMEVENVLLWALAKVISEWTGSELVEITIVGNGHDLIVNKYLDLSRTLGLIATDRILILENIKFTDWLKEIVIFHRQIKEIPDNGYAYFLATNLNDDAQVVKRLKKNRKGEIYFNYRGLIHQKNDASDELKLLPQQYNSKRNLQNNRGYTFTIGGDIIHHSLSFEWEYSYNLCRRETVERLAYRYIQILKELIPKLEG